MSVIFDGGTDNIIHGALITKCLINQVDVVGVTDAQVLIFLVLLVFVLYIIFLRRGPLGHSLW